MKRQQRPHRTCPPLVLVGRHMPGVVRGTGAAGAYGPWSAGWHGRARAARKKARQKTGRSDPLRPLVPSAGA